MLFLRFYLLTALAFPLFAQPVAPHSIPLDSVFAAAGGASALSRVQDLTSRVGFGAQTASRQSRLLSQLGNLESLEGAASFASQANNITSAISAGYDIYNCVTKP